ncbi:retrotransposon protein, putative, ty1-copia subclass [Tanacetum coccineum]
MTYIKYGWSDLRPEAYDEMVGVVQNTNNTTIRSILLAEKLTGSNFTNWYHNLRIVLSTMSLSNLEARVACLMLSSMVPDLQKTLEKYNAFDMMNVLKTMFEEQAKQELFEIVKAFHACKQEDGQLVSSYLLKMKSYLDTLERLCYAMPKELGISKKAKTPAVLAIWEGKIQKDKKKPQGAKGKNNGKHKLAYAPIKGLRRVGEVETWSYKRAKHGLDSYYLWHCRLGDINKKRMDMLQHDGLLQPTHDESHEKCKSCIYGKMACKPFPHQVERAKDLLGLIHTDVFLNEADQLVKKKKAILSIKGRGGEYLSHKFVNHMKSCGIVSQLTPPYTQQHSGVSERRNQTLLDMFHGTRSEWESLTLEVRWKWDNGLNYFREDTQPSKNTSKEHKEVAPIEVEPQSVGVLIRRSARIPQAPDRYGYYVDVEEYELGDFGEPPNYIATLVDPESDNGLKL